jgi:hypothetical protein
MRRVESPPTAPIDADMFLVVDDLGIFGRVYRETRVDAADEKTVINDIQGGQYECPERIIAFNTQEGWSRDVTEDVARAIANSVWDRSDLGKSAQEFLQRQLGENWDSTHGIKNSRHAVKTFA